MRNFLPITAAGVVARVLCSTRWYSSFVSSFEKFYHVSDTWLFATGWCSIVRDKEILSYPTRGIAFVERRFLGRNFLRWSTRCCYDFKFLEREYKWKFNLYSIKLSDLSRESRSMLKLYNCWITRHQWINFNVLAAIIFHSTTAFKSSGNGYASFWKLLGIGSNLHTLSKRINPIRVVITLEFESNWWLGKFEKPKWTRSHTYLFQVNATIRWNSETRGRRRKCERIKYFT